MCSGARGSGLVVLLVALLVLPVAGHAQTAPDDDEAATAKTELAKRHCALGELYYRQGDSAKALAAFQEAHRLCGKPELLYNMGRCHEALGDLAAAIESFERYLKESRATNPDLRMRIQHLRARLAQRPEAPYPSPPRPASTLPQQGPASLHALPIAPPASTRRWMRPTAWALIGVGGALLGTGIALGVVASSRAKDVEQAFATGRQEWADVEGTEESGKALEAGMIASTVVGALAVAGGVALHLLAPRAERRLSLIPFVDGRTAGLGTQIRF